MLYAGAMGVAFAAHGQDARNASITLDTIGGAVDYFQSRRRHFVSLLYTMPHACSGSLVLQPYDALTVLLPQVEHSCIAITGFHHKLALLEALPDFSLEVDGIGAMASHDFETLDDYFLEPERASIHVMAELRGDQFTMPAMEPVDGRKIFSTAELRNGVKLIGATYEAFGLKDSDFSAMGVLVVAFARYSRDDFYVEIEKDKFRSMLRAQNELDPTELETLLVNIPSDYATNTNAYQPFLDLGDRVVSNVNLLSRFLYAFKNVHLGSRRRFQIHAGFIFEDMVKRDLERMGFTVTNIKRINRKEFDVVATHDGVIFNIQCKNNWIDLSKIEAERKLFVRYNRSLTNYYSRALKKERGREHLLKQATGYGQGRALRSQPVSGHRCRRSGDQLQSDRTASSHRSGGRVTTGLADIGEMLARFTGPDLTHTLARIESGVRARNGGGLCELSRKRGGVSRGTGRGGGNETPGRPNQRYDPCARHPVVPSTHPRTG